MMVKEKKRKVFKGVKGEDVREAMVKICEEMRVEIEDK